MFPRLLVLAMASEALYLLLAAQSPIPPAESPLAAWYRAERFEQTVSFLAPWAALFLLYAFAIRASSKTTGRSLAFYIFATSALFRASLLWSGGIEAEVEPPSFLHASSPLEAAASSLETRLSGTEAPLRALAAALFDLGSLSLTFGLLRASALPAGLALVYGWNPLLVKEISGSGRVDAIGVFFLLLALRWAGEARPGGAALAYGASLTGSPVLLATLPLFARALGARLVLSLVVCGAAWGALLSSLPLADAVSWPPRDFAGGSLLPSLLALARLFVTRNDLVTVAIASLALTALLLRGAFRLRADLANLPREILVVLGWVLFLSPQVPPWAFLPIASLAAYSPNRGWIVFTATAPLTYFALGDGNWNFWLGFTQYFPAYACLIYAWLGRERE